MDTLIDNYSHVDLREDNRLNELLDVLTSEDFGIEDGWEYDEDMEEDDEPEETDDEFTERIDNIY